jgi:acyl-CoA hydrolase
MVAIDENGQSLEVPRLILETEVEIKHYAAAELRRKMRQESLEKSRALYVELSEEEF